MVIDTQDKSCQYRSPPLQIIVRHLTSLLPRRELRRLCIPTCKCRHLHVNIIRRCYVRTYTESVKRMDAEWTAFYVRRERDVFLELARWRAVEQGTFLAEAQRTEREDGHSSPTGLDIPSFCTFALVSSVLLCGFEFSLLVSICVEQVRRFVCDAQVKSIELNYVFCCRFSRVARLIVFVCFLSNLGFTEGENKAL